MLTCSKKLSASWFARDYESGIIANKSSEILLIYHNAQATLISYQTNQFTIQEEKNTNQRVLT